MPTLMARPQQANVENASAAALLAAGGGANVQRPSETRVIGSRRVSAATVVDP
jgi:hypothetical protein